MKHGHARNPMWTSGSLPDSPIGESAAKLQALGWRIGSLLIPAILVWSFILPTQTLVWQCGLRVAAALSLLLFNLTGETQRWIFATVFGTLFVSAALLAARILHLHIPPICYMAAGLLDVVLTVAVLRLSNSLNCPPSTRYLIGAAAAFLLWSLLANALHTYDQPSSISQRFQPHVTATVLAQSQWLSALQIHSYVLSMLLVFSYRIACGENRLLAISLATSAGVLACAVIYQHFAGEYSYLFENGAIGAADMGRVRVGFRDHHSVTVVLAVTLLSVLAWNLISLRRLAFCLPWIILLTVAVTFNSTRSAMLTLLVTVPLAVLFSNRRRWLTAAAVAACLYFAVGAEHLLYKKSLTGIEEDATVSEVTATNTPRMMLAVRGAQQIGTTWFSGAGYGRNFFELRTHDFWGYRFTNSGHMLPIDVALGAGIIGGLLFLLFLGGMLVVGLRQLWSSWLSGVSGPQHGRLLAGVVALGATLLLCAFNTVEGGIGLDLGFLWAGYLLAGARAEQSERGPDWSRLTRFLHHRKTELGFAAAVLLLVSPSCCFQIHREGRYYGLVHLSFTDVAANSPADERPRTIYVNSASGIEEMKRYWPANFKSPQFVLIEPGETQPDPPPGAYVVWDALHNHEFSSQISRWGYGKHVYFDWRSPIDFPEHWRLFTAYHSQRGLDVYRIEERLTENIIQQPTDNGDSANSPDSDVRFALDGDARTYWNGGADMPVTFEIPLSETAHASPVVWYSITSTDRFSREHDPRGWRLEGSHNSKDWFLLDEQTNVSFMGFKERQSFRTKTPATCRFLRLRFDRVNEAGRSLHLSELDVRAQLISGRQASENKVPRGN